MKISFTDRGYCSMEFDSETDSDRYLLRQVYLKLMGRTADEQRACIAKILEDLE